MAKHSSIRRASLVALSSFCCIPACSDEAPPSVGLGANVGVAGNAGAGTIVSGGTAGDGGAPGVESPGPGPGGASGGTPAAGGAPSGGSSGTAGATAQAGSGGASSSGGYAMTITLDTSATGANVEQAVQNYPVAILLDASHFDFSQAAPGGEDVAFAKPDGEPLPHSVELWDSAAGRAALWVKMDEVAGSTPDQQIRMTWGSPEAVSTADSHAVFSMADGFVGVWHLGEDGNTTAGGYADASDNEAHGTGVDMVPGSQAEGRIGNAVDLNNATGQDTARWIRVDGEKAAAFNPGPPITVSIWALAHSYPIRSYETIIAKGDTSWSLQRVQYEDTGYQSCLLAGGQPGYHFCIYDFAAQPLVTEEWLHFMVVLEEPNMTLYINGELNSTGSGGGWNQGDHPLGIGNQTQILGGRRQWDGILDEARVMQAARSASWAKLDYESQRAEPTLLTYGPVEPL